MRYAYGKADVDRQLEDGLHQDVTNIEKLAPSLPLDALFTSCSGGEGRCRQKGDTNELTIYTLTTRNLIVEKPVGTSALSQIAQPIAGFRIGYGNGGRVRVISHSPLYEHVKPGTCDTDAYTCENADKPHSGRIQDRSEYTTEPTLGM